ncbi:hypothetical protein KOW79_011224 [Hemibagrus wyckioides]|uniref:Uncharacterized protein n=1 Tax=Hemibagrus wyckioides TaxID=337641 RepID=A0A9D3NL29_9TELE|nr:hypothetical protein KOW79_011224 [Hemibagrus wyckioides]
MLEVILVSLLQAQNSPPGLLVSIEKSGIDRNKVIKRFLEIKVHSFHLGCSVVVRRSSSHSASPADKCRSSLLPAQRGASCVPPITLAVFQSFIHTPETSIACQHSPQ